MSKETEVRQSPWGKLGIPLEDKCYDTQVALEKTGMDWTVSKKALYTVIEGEQKGLDNRVAIVRDDNHEILEVVSKGYDILQTKEAFDFFNIFLHEKELYLRSALELRGGRKVCVVGQLEDNVREIVPNDTVCTYLILAASHDGSLKTTVKFTNIRPVCENTLMAALVGAGAFEAVRHTKNQRTRLAQVQASINLYKAKFEEEVLLYKDMAKKPMNLEDTRRYLENLFSKELTDAAKRAGVPRDEYGLEDFRATKKILGNFLFSPDLQMPHVENTAWAAYNAVTEFISHQRSYDSDSRTTAMWFGPDARLLDRAKELVLAV